MKAIAHNLRALIEIELKTAEMHGNEEKKLWDMAFEAGKTNREEGEKIYRLSMAEADKVFEAENRLRRLRTALWNILEIMGVEFDSWHPETAEF